MNKGDKLWIHENGAWLEATYEFRCVDQEPLGHHSVMLANGGGRRVVCGCKTSTVPVPAVGEKWRDKGGESGAVTITKATDKTVSFAPAPDECWLQSEYEFPLSTFQNSFEPVSETKEQL